MDCDSLGLHLVYVIIHHQLHTVTIELLYEKHFAYGHAEKTHNYRPLAHFHARIQVYSWIQNAKIHEETAAS